MVIGILNFGEGLLPLTFLVMVTVASLGAIQIAAAQARLIGLLLLPSAYSRWLGAGLVAGSYIWFFSVQPGLFIPGLAGGELFTLFLIGFGLSVLISLGFGIISNRLLVRRPGRRTENSESIDFGKGQHGVLSLPVASHPPLIVALREADTDSLDVLCGELVAAGAAVLLCNYQAAAPALAWAEREAARFNPRCCIIGLGRGADYALARAGEPADGVLALAPFGDSFHARPGLRWLRETDYLTGIRATWHRPPIEPARSADHARIIYGDEDLLIRPGDARKMFPNAIMVAGARHFNLAAMPAVLRLTADLLELHVHTERAPVAPIAPVPREANK